MKKKRTYHFWKSEKYEQLHKERGSFVSRQASINGQVVDYSVCNPAWPEPEYNITGTREDGENWYNTRMGQFAPYVYLGEGFIYAVDGILHRN